MPRDTSSKPHSRSSIEVVVPRRRMKGWTGWVEVPWEEDTKQEKPVEEALPPGKKRTRSQTKRLKAKAEQERVTKRKATVPSGVPAATDKQDQTQTTRIRVGGRLRTKEYNQLEREIKRLGMQNDLLAVAESREIQKLRAKVERLENLKVKQREKVELLASRLGDSASDIMKDETEIIRMKDQEIEQQKITIRDLQSSLSSALKFNGLFSMVRDEGLPTTAVVDFNREMKWIELGVLRTAELLSSCLHPLDHVSHTIHIHPDLGDMISKAIGGIKVFTSMPGLALRGLLFHIIRDHIVYSEMWTALHLEGYMLRGYQKAIQQTTTSDFFESFHKAAFSHMLKNDSEFKTCFLDAHAEELQTHIMALLDPLLDPVQLQTQEMGIHRELKALLSEVLSWRARCCPADGIRYEVVQFKPGQLFDPGLMEAQDAAGNRVPVPNRRCPITLCVHGLVMAHTIQMESSGLQKIKELSQPFQTPHTQNEKKPTGGEIISGKAIVIL
ncbi:hypothetical protein BDV39DRAFT_218877 [Aspergillus sergii]|uniref:Uncharacterized protein n=1 Tax=Aspergillus sergii TaxID=1034303 RepID=A0A5N6WNN4_9EURO|nr:hypothetical protein BDV39DRAFT_218877 [Aspergillus sergii]